jgi:hypothetical protein
MTIGAIGGILSVKKSRQWQNSMGKMAPIKI